MRISVPCLFLLICTGLLFANEAKPADIPQLPDRRPIDADFERLLANLEPEIASGVKKRRSKLGIATKLSDSQLKHFRDRGTHWHVLYDYIAEFGITPEENRKLARSGLNFALNNAADLNAWHWAALSDVVVEGTIKEMTGFEKGPYHTRIQLVVSEVYKNCEARSPGSLRTFWLLNTGPHRHENHVHSRVDPTEPDFRVGEQVVLMAGRQPHALRTLVGNSLMNDGMDKITEAYGNENSLLTRASRGSPDVLEIYMAYKVVRHNLVAKGGGFRLPQTSDVVDREHFGDRVNSIYRQQAQYCRERVRSMEVGR